MSVVIKWIMVRGVERERVFLLTEERNEGGHKAGYGERVRTEVFLLTDEKNEGGYKADYGERGGERGCFC